MSVLYVNNRGREVVTHSYSSGQTFSSCRRKYYLQKVAGWRQKERSAALEFGKAFEQAIQYFHENGLVPDSGVEDYKRRWLVYKDDAELVYKPADGSWLNLYHAGAQLMKLYEILLPSLPIFQPVFQVNYTRQVFPGTDLADLYDQGYLDCVSKCQDWDHPLLPKVKRPANATHRVVAVDIKTAGKELSVTADILGLDPQLRRYASLSGISDQSFLWAVKSSYSAYQKGTEITFLTASDDWKAGDKAVVYKYDRETEVALLTTHAGIQKMDELMEAIKGKGSTDRKEALIAERLLFGDLLEVKSEQFTKQKLQYLAVRISEEAIHDATEQVAQEVAAIHDANLKNSWLPSPSIRFPDTKCCWCAYRGNCTNNNALRDSLLVQITDPNAVVEEIEEDFGFGDE
jgi:hypothetical protein